MSEPTPLIHYQLLFLILYYGFTHNSYCVDLSVTLLHHNWSRVSDEHVACAQGW